VSGLPGCRTCVIWPQSASPERAVEPDERDSQGRTA